MLVRIWTTGIIKERLGEYKAFAQQYSMPMFKSFAGLHDVYMCIDEKAALSKVITIWQDKSYIEQMEQSVSYKATVRDIVAGGFLTSDQQTEVFSLFAHHSNSGF